MGLKTVFQPIGDPLIHLAPQPSDSWPFITYDTGITTPNLDVITSTGFGLTGACYRAGGANSAGSTKSVGGRLYSPYSNQKILVQHQLIRITVADWQTGHNNADFNFLAFDGTNRHYGVIGTTGVSGGLLRYINSAGSWVNGPWAALVEETDFWLHLEIWLNITDGTTNYIINGIETGWVASLIAAQADGPHLYTNWSIAVLNATTAHIYLGELLIEGI